jgi:monooxygenase
LLKHMDEQGFSTCTPRAPGPALAREPFLDLESGYVLRSLESLPKQGPRTPWRLHQSYVRDIRMLRHGPLEDEAMEFSSPASPASEPDRVLAAA